MAFDSLVITQKIITSLSASSGTSVIPLFSYTPYTQVGYRLISESLELNNLKAVSWIYNLAEVEFPVFELTASESEQLLSTINLEWTSPRIQLDLLCRIGTEAWNKIASYSLLNPSPFPYRDFELGSHILGNNAILGLQLVDVNYGNLKDTSTGQDKVVILGDLIRNIVVEKMVDTSTKIANNITTTAANIVNSNANRKGLTIFNNSSVDVYIDTVSSVSTSAYMLKLLPNKYYEAPSPIYTGNYYAVVATGSTAIDIREFI